MIKLNSIYVHLKLMLFSMNHCIRFKRNNFLNYLITYFSNEEKNKIKT